MEELGCGSAARGRLAAELKDAGRQGLRVKGERGWSFSVRPSAKRCLRAAAGREARSARTGRAPMPDPGGGDGAGREAV